MKHFYSDNE